MSPDLFNKKQFYRLIRITSWGVIYYVVAWFSLTYFLTEEGIAIAWPPVGIFISALLLSRPHERPYIIIVLMLADFLADMHTDVSYLTKFIYAVLSTGDASLSAFILLKFVANPFTLTKARNLLLYVLLSIVLCSGFFSVLVSLVTSVEQGSDFLTGFLYSWVADGVGNLMIVPVVITWSSLKRDDLKFINPKRTTEILILLLLLVTLNILLFPFSSDGLLFSFIINYLSFPFIIWAILRFDMKTVTMVLLIMTLTMLFNLIQDSHVLSDSTVNRHFIFFQLYVASIAIISLFITAITAERNQAHKALLKSEENYRTVADYTYAWEYWMDAEGIMRYVSPAAENITGYEPREFISDPELLNRIVFKDDQYMWEQHKKEMFSPETDKHKHIEFRILSKNGKIKWIGHDCRHIHSDGIYLGLRVSNRDITSLVETERKLLFNTVETEERERSRYSRELHDGLGPLLSTIKMYIQGLCENRESARFRIFAEESNNIIKIAIQTMREIAYGISPFNLNHSGYVNAVKEFAERINKAHQLKINFTYNTKIRLSSFYEIILYRITTELINNTIKYAAATQVKIQFKFDEAQRMVSLNYNDDGQGFDIRNKMGKNGDGMGLMNIQHRINILRGNFRIESGEKRGTNVYIDFPVNEREVKVSAESNLSL